MISILPPPLHPLPLFLSSYLLRSFYFFFFFSSSSRVRIHFFLSVPRSPYFASFLAFSVGTIGGRTTKRARFNFEGVAFVLVPRGRASGSLVDDPFTPWKNRRVGCQRDFCTQSCHSVCARGAHSRHFCPPGNTVEWRGKVAVITRR